jgi:hypothetical protein
LSKPRLHRWQASTSRRKIHLALELVKNSPGGSGTRVAPSRARPRREPAEAQPLALEVGDSIELAAEPAAALGALDTARQAGDAELLVGVAMDAPAVTLQHPRSHVLGAGAERHGGEHAEHRRFGSGIARPGEGGFKIAGDDGVEHIGGRRDAAGSRS